MFPGRQSAPAPSRQSLTLLCRHLPQVYPKLYLSGGSMYDAKWWQWLIRVWELTGARQDLRLLQSQPWTEAAAVVMRHSSLSGCAMTLAGRSSLSRGVAPTSVEHGAFRVEYMHCSTSLKGLN